MKVKVPEPGLVSVYVQTELRKQAGAANETACIVGVGLPGESLFRPVIQIASGPSNDYFFHESAPGSSFTGSERSDGGWVVYPIPTGKQTITLSLRRFGNAAVCRFRNTQFHVAPAS